MTEPTIEVTLAYPYTDGEKTHDADSTITLPKHIGKDLIRAGRARLPEPAPKSPAKKASGNPATQATAQKEK